MKKQNCSQERCSNRNFYCLPITQEEIWHLQLFFITEERWIKLFFRFSNPHLEVRYPIYMWNVSSAQEMDAWVDAGCSQPATLVCSPCAFLLEESHQLTFEAEPPGYQQGHGGVDLCCSLCRHGVHSLPVEEPSGWISWCEHHPLWFYHIQTWQKFIQPLWSRACRPPLLRRVSNWRLLPPPL